MRSRIAPSGERAVATGSGSARSGKVLKSGAAAKAGASGLSCGLDEPRTLGAAMAGGDDDGKSGEPDDEAVPPDGPGDGDRLYSLAPGAMCGGCEIVRPLGAGTYGEVYLAIDPHGQHCAIKRMQMVNRTDAKTRQRFLQEGAILKFVEHDNMVRCFDYGADPDGTLWMRLEYLQGHTLRDLLHLGGPMHSERVLRLGRQVCRGLKELHEQAAAHRDIKPENLFVLENDQLKVLDFGLVKTVGSALKTTGRVALGTTLYFAPDYLEHEPAIHGDDPDPRWDVYSVGMTLYEMRLSHPFLLLLGRLPPPMVAVKMHLDGEIPHLADHGIEPDVADVIMKAIARNPDDRFASAMELEAAMAKVHAVRLGRSVRDTAAPRTVSAKLRIGHATTEPDVVRQLTQAGGVRVPVRPALVTPSSTPPALGPQGTTRLVLSPAPSRASERRASTPAVVERPAASRAPAPRDASRTEPFDRSRLPPRTPPANAIEPARPAPEPARKATEAAAGAGPTPSSDDFTAALPADEIERNAAELAFWLRQGGLPPDVAAKLGLRVLPAAGAGAPPPAEGPKPAVPARRAAPDLLARLRPHLRWEAMAKPLCVIVMIASMCAIAYALVRRYGGPTPSTPPAEAGPITVSIATVTWTAPPPVAEPEPPAQEPATSSRVTASATSSAPPSGPPRVVTPAPKSTRANDIYPTMDDDPPPKPKPAPPSKSAATTNATAEAPKPTPAPTFGLPFGKEED